MATAAGISLLALLVAGQLIAPRIAGSLVRARLARYGRVQSVRVSAFPWLQLLWQHADRVTARLADATLTSAELERLLHEGGGARTVEVTIGVVHIGPLALRDVRFDKHGSELHGAGTLELVNIRSALPFLRSLTPVDDANGEFVLRGTAGVLGVSVSVEVVVAARDGNLVVAPNGPLAGFATVTLYADPRVSVQSVSAVAVPGAVRFSSRGVLH